MRILISWSILQNFWSPEKWRFRSPEIRSHDHSPQQSNIEIKTWSNTLLNCKTTFLSSVSFQLWIFDKFFLFKKMSRYKSFRLDRKSPLLKQDSNNTSEEKLEVIQQFRYSNLFPATEKLKNLFKDDHEFICRCLSICMEINQVF